MARFLITVWPFPGHYFPLIPIAHALRRLGHDVAFYSGAKARTTIEGEGFECFPFERIDEERVDAIMYGRGAYASGSRPLRLRAILREWLLGTVPHQVSDLEPILDRFRPDVVVSETSMWAPILVLRETRRVPVAVFSTVFACMLPGPEAPPYGLGLARPRTTLGRFRVRLIRAAGEVLAGGFRRAANRVRADYDLPPLDVSVTEHTGRLPLYLMPSTPELDYERGDLPSSVKYVGPCRWNKPRTDAAPEWLVGLPTDRPWVHVTEGTMHAERPVVLSAAARGLGGLSMPVIMTTGVERSPADLGLAPLEANVRVEQWVPHDDLLPHTGVVVTTGGAGTITTVLSAGVPLIVVPTEWDKPENAQRVVEAGAGLRIAPQRCTPSRLRSAVERVLGDDTFRKNALRLAESFERYGGPARAAELLESLASG